MELTHLFEQISGSDEFKEEYERLEREKKAAEDEQIFSYQKKKGLAQERTSMRKQKEEAEKYTALVEQRTELRRQLALMRLFKVEKEVASLSVKGQEAKAQAEADTAAHAEMEEGVKTNEKEKARLARKTVELERKVTKLQEQIEGKVRAIIMQGAKPMPRRRYPIPPAARPERLQTRAVCAAAADARRDPAARGD